MNTGVVQILYGSNAGLTALPSELWWGSSQNARFGAELVAANFGYSTHSDLAIGAPGQTIANLKEAGSVQILYGSANGLTPANTQFLNMGWGVSQGDLFGAALALLAFITMSQVSVPDGSTVRVQYVPHPRDMIQIKEGTPFIVPDGAIFTLTGLGNTQQASTVRLFVDGQVECVANFDGNSGNGSSVKTTAPGFTVRAGSAIGLVSVDASASGRAWGYLVRL